MNPTRCEITIRGPVSAVLLDTLQARFGEARALVTHDTTLVLDDADQARIRALLVLLWDAGHELLSLTSTPRV